MQVLRNQLQFLGSPFNARSTTIGRRHLIRQPIESRKRSTRRATDEVDPPRDPFQKNTAWRSGGSPPPPKNNTSFNAFKKSKEPFEAELLILFGLPTLIILIPWAVKDPAALAIIPIAFLIPGVRDVLLAVLQSTFLGVRRAKRFMKEDGGEYYDDDRYDSRSAAAGYSGTWSARSPSPPPPPPPSPGSSEGSFYDLTQEDFTVEPAADQVESLEENGVEEEGGIDSRYEVQLEEEEETETKTRRRENENEEAEQQEEEQPPPPPEPRSPSKRRWVSYNTSASFAEDEERKAKAKSSNKNSQGDVRRLKTIPASPLAQVRWREERRYSSSSSDDEEDGEDNGMDGGVLDEEIETIKWKQEREKRRQARAARRQQRLDSVINSSTTSDVTLPNTTLPTPPAAPQQKQQQPLRRNPAAAAPYRKSNYNANSFWGNENADDQKYYFENDGVDSTDNGTGRYSGRKGRRKGGVPWYARPVVTLFPFLKDWGGFM